MLPHYVACCWPRILTWTCRDQTSHCWSSTSTCDTMFQNCCMYQHLGNWRDVANDANRVVKSDATIRVLLHTFMNKTTWRKLMCTMCFCFHLCPSRGLVSASGDGYHLFICHATGQAQFWNMEGLSECCQQFNLFSRAFLATGCPRATNSLPFKHVMWCHNTSHYVRKTCAYFAGMRIVATKLGNRRMSWQKICKAFARITNFRTSLLNWTIVILICCWYRKQGVTNVRTLS